MKMQRAFAVLLGCCFLAATASAATATYRWQVSNGQSVAGYTTNWTQTCGQDLIAMTALTVTTMKTDPFPCDQAGMITTTQPGPFDFLLMIRPTPYGSATDVTGGNIRWYLRDRDGGGVTFRISLGYAQGGTFNSFGFVDQTVTNNEGLFVLDLSAIAGTAPAGSNLATLVTIQSNGNGNEARLYLADDRNTNDWSGEITLDETISCTQTGSLSVTPGQTSNGNPVDLTTISTATGSINEVYEVYEGGCPTGATFDQLDDFTGLANGTRPNFGNWTGVNGSDGTLGWVALSVGTASSNTGPASGNPNPYVYLESSASSQTYGVDVTGGSSQYVESNVIDASAWVLSFTFDWNMNVNGNTNASIHLDAWDGAVWDLDVTGGTINTGNNGDVWVTQGPIDLSAYTNADFKLRVRYVVGTTGNVWQNDVAIDNLNITGSERVTPIFSGDQTQAQSVDTSGWTGPTMCLILNGDDAACGTPLPQAQDTFTWSPVDNRTTVGVVSAVPSGCDGITVTAPYTDDDNADNTLSYRYRTPSGSGTWTAPVNLPHSASPYSFTVGGLSFGVTYDMEVTYNDDDGVNGTNPQVIGPVSTLDCRVTPGTPSANVDAFDQITVSAPFSDDANGNSSTDFERAPDAVGPWTAACSNISGASPRNCVDSVAESSTYYYRITFADPDGVNGQVQQVIGPFTTPAWAVNYTNVDSNSAVVNTCQQITVTSVFSDDANGNSSTQVEYSLFDSWPGTTACSNLTGASPRQCMIHGLTPGSSYYLRITYDDPDGVDAPGVTPKSFVIGPYALPTCGADDAAATVIFLSPTSGATVGGGERVKVQIYDEAGLAAVTPVSWSVDGGAFSTAVSVNANYDCGAGCNIFEFDLDTTVLLNRSHYLTVQATDAAGNVATRSLSLIVSNSGTVPTGGGYLLRRTHSSQLCLDCHALATHSSQHIGTKYGNVGFECLACHTPHRTRNVFLVRETIATPHDGDKTVTFRNTAGKADQSYATVTSPGNGICEVCHTKTRNSDGTPRYRNTGESDGGKHYTSRCTGCHPHSKGFWAGESEGGTTCSGCHSGIWDGMSGALAKVSKHAIGNILGVNDAFTDTATSWSDPLSANAAADRSCVNMCHQDHIHNQPGFTDHDYNVHQDAGTQASRTVTRTAGYITGGSPDQTDFNGAAASGGMCMSCHQNSVDASRPALDTAAYDNSAHDFVSNTVDTTTYDWAYTQHDGSTFERNCSKCHTDRSDSGGGPDAGTFPFGAVHFSDYPWLLAGSTNPNGTAGDFICYNCHGNDAGGTVDRSGKNLASQVSKAFGHPTDSDAVHDSVAEWTGAAFGNQLGGAARHVSCLDCHDPHQAGAGTHATGTNRAGPPLEGSWGAELSSYPSFWVAPNSGNFTKKKIVAGIDAEATLCFKCHSNYYGTLPTSPSGGFQQTDTAREFNPNNGGPGGNQGSYHPVLASAGSNLGATSNIKAPWTRDSLMTCSDCHESNSTADPNGPHGSTAGFLLKGPNTLWNETLQASQGNAGSMPNGTFCINCHNQDFNGSRFPPSGMMGRGGHGYSKHTTRYDTKCFNCHAAIPHGTARPGLLVSPRSQSVGGLQVTDAYPYLQLPAGNLGLQINSYPANNTTAWSKSNCACGNDGWGH